MNSKQRKKAGKATKVLVKAIEGGHFDEVLAALERPAFVERAAALLGHAWTWPPDGKGFYVSKAIAARQAILTIAKITINGAMLSPGSYSGSLSRPWRSNPPIQQFPRSTKLADLKKFLRGSQVVSMSVDDTFAFDVETYKTSPDEVRVVPPPAPQDPYEEAIAAYRVVARRAAEGGAFDRLYNEGYMTGGDSLSDVCEKVAEAIRELAGPPPDGLALAVNLWVCGRPLTCVVRP